jgi:Flp pilus assembly protein TadD
MRNKSKAKKKGPAEKIQQTVLLLFQNGNFVQMASECRQLIRRYPTHGFAWKSLGAALQALGQNEQALQIKLHTASLCPDDAEVLTNLGNALVKCHNSLQAIPVLRRAVAIDPQCAIAQMNLGFSLLQNGLIEASIAASRLAETLSPANPQIKSNLGAALIKLDCMKEAADCFLAALHISPDHLDALVGYGVVCRSVSQLPLAITYFRKALAARLLQPSQLLKQAHRQSFSSTQNESLMWKALTQLAAAGVHAFATSGTLLGLQREGGLLSFDKDIDFGLPFVEHEKARAYLLNHGWQENISNYGLINPRAYQHIATGLSLDLFGFKVEAETGITLGGLWLKDAPPDWSRVTEHPTIQLHCVPGPQGPVWALNDPHAWLEAVYGDWRTPDPNFDTVIAAKNLRGFSLLTQCYAFSRILESWQNGDLKKALSTTSHSRHHLPDDALLQQVQMHLQTAIQQSTPRQRHA